MRVCHKITTFPNVSSHNSYVLYAASVIMKKSSCGITVQTYLQVSKGIILSMSTQEARLVVLFPDQYENHRVICQVNLGLLQVCTFRMAPLLLLKKKRRFTESNIRIINVQKIKDILNTSEENQNIGNYDRSKWRCQARVKFEVPVSERQGPVQLFLVWRTGHNQFNTHNIQSTNLWGFSPSANQDQ